MKILILTLPQCEERRANISKSIEPYGYDFEFIYNDPNLEPPKVESVVIHPVEWVKIEYNMQPTKGEWGCKLGHMKIYETILERGYDDALILEDDALWRCDVVKVIEAARKAKPWADIISGCIHKSWWRDKDPWQTIMRGKWKCETLDFQARYMGWNELNWYYNPANTIGSNACYWINRNAAKKLLEINKKYDVPCDILIHNPFLSDLKVAYTKQVLVETHYLPSVIQSLPDGEDRHCYTSHCTKATTYRHFCTGKKIWWGGQICYDYIPIEETKWAPTVS